MSKRVKTTMTLEVEIRAEGHISRGHPGDSGFRSGTVGLACNPSPPEPPEMEDVSVWLGGVDITKHLSDVEYEAISASLWDAAQSAEDTHGKD